MIKFVQLSSLEKVFLNYNVEQEDYCFISVLKNESFSYQIAYRNIIEEKEFIKKKIFKIKVDSPLKDYIKIFTVENIPSELTTFDNDPEDEDFLSTQPGLFPDLLKPIKREEIEVITNKTFALWIKVDPDNMIDAGNYPIKISFENEEESFSKTLNVEVIDAALPEQKMIYTQWFHCDCIADAYRVKVFSKAHWELIEKFMKKAVEGGINMILTPLFTPPLDTQIGGERTTVQLVDVEKTADGYIFGFDRLEKWVEIAKKSKIKYFEMSHLFTQWGVKAAPKIIAKVNGRKKRIFGWETDAKGKEYKEFLDAFLPALVKQLKKMGIDKNCVFHISDEPSGEEHLQNYLSAKKIVSPHLKGFKIIDALSQLDFYTKGAVENPVPSTEFIDNFIEAKVKDLWAYYYCDTKKGLCNRYFAMPSWRNRAIGLQLYKYDIKGFLHWGYNFYYSQYSRELIDPMRTSDARCGFPSGDAYSVYPGEDGPLESIRFAVFRDALSDIRALNLLESYIGKEKTVEVVETAMGKPVIFYDYPRSSEKFMKIREAVNKKIKECIK